MSTDYDTDAPNPAAVLCDVRWMVSRFDMQLNRELLTILDAHGQPVPGVAAEDGMGIDEAVLQIIRTEEGLAELASWVQRARRHRLSSLQNLERWFPAAVAEQIAALESGATDTRTINQATTLIQNGAEAMLTRLPEALDPSTDLDTALHRLLYLQQLVDRATAGM